MNPRMIAAAARRLTLSAALSLSLSHAVLAEALLKPLPNNVPAALAAPDKAVISDAREAFEKAKINLVGDDLAGAYARIGAVYARYQIWDVARTALANAVALAPEDGRYYYLQGFFEEQSKDPMAARASYEKALALDADYLPIRYRLANLYIEQKNLGLARSILEPLSKDRPDLAPAFATLGQIALQERRFADAAVLFKKALAIEPKATALNSGLADALAGSGDAKDAAQVRAQAGDGQPGYADPLIVGIYAPVPTDAAGAALRMALEGQHDAARQLLESELKKKPNAADLHSAYARVDADSGRQASAKQHAQTALTYAPNDASVLVSMGMVLEIGGDDTGAAGFYERAVKADPRSGEAHIALGNSYLRRSQYAQAADQFRQLLAISENGNDALLRMVAAQAAGGHCADAINDVETIRKTRSNDGVLAQLSVRLAASCAAANAGAKKLALSTAKSLYQQRPSAAHAEALAMALAATGTPKDAVDYEAQAIFDSVKEKDQGAVERRRAWMKRFEAGQAVDTPWPPGHPLLAPARLAASTSGG